VEFGNRNADLSDESKGVFRGTNGKTLFFERESGTLFARVTASDHGIVAETLLTLARQEWQVMIAVKLIEVTGTAHAALPPSAATNSTVARSTSPSVLDVRGDEVNWSGRHVANAHALRVTLVSGLGFSSILDEAPAGGLLRALADRDGVDVLSAPPATRPSGRTVQVRSEQMQTLAASIDPRVRVEPGKKKPASRNLPTYLTVQVPIGPTLDVTAVISPDGEQIELAVAAAVSEFVGYDPPGPDPKVRVWQGGRKKLVEVPLPRFRVRELQAKAVVRDGQTLLLGAWPVSELPRRTAREFAKRLLVLVTPIIVDAAGARVHGPDLRPP
jgi:type II secretory pathway component GspD/PulD (secretin)